jgi:hypothetical protein
MPKSKPPRPADVEPDLPPVVPTTSADLERAIVLLGERAKGELRAKTASKLTSLVGEYPDVITAKRWKNGLLKCRGDEIFD